jgi:N-acetylneuraminic acid mutarotase
MPVAVGLDWRPNSPGGTAVYGTRGVAAPDNLPGARSGGVTWIDASGNFRLFGGIGGAPEAYFNDLWQYSTVTGQWTWMGGANTPNALGVYGTQGVAASGNMPGARAGAVSWTDAAGNLWLFGGTGFDSVRTAPELNDLWKYSPSTGLWTWLSGSNTSDADGVYGTRGMAAAANVPPARDDATSWIDASGNLWLFGGNGLLTGGGGSGIFNDLWEYNPTSDMWTWVSGQIDANDDNGVYGTRGVAAPSNMPGARRGAAGWIDASGSLWLFGGAANFTPELEFYSDLWKFDPHTGLWTWMSGSNELDDTGQYGSEGTAAAASYPPPRSDARAVVDHAGMFWLFGGNGVNPGLGELDLGPGQFNDLWRFDPATGEWTWMSGSMGTGGTGTYGMQGVAAPGNVPPARAAAFLWIDSDRNLFLFGGAGPFPGAGEVEWNDLWKFAGADFP